VTLGWLCALLIAWLSVAGAGELLHGELHDDACAPEHECAITLFAQGTHVPAEPGELVTAPPKRLVGQISPASDFPHAANDAPLRPGRGPPVG
jgi:hypothetical protein